MTFVVYINAKNPSLRIDNLAKIGNFCQHVVMSPSVTTFVNGRKILPHSFIVVMSDMTPEDVKHLEFRLLHEPMFITEVSEEELALLKKGSGLRMRIWLMESRFETLPTNQMHLLQPLCQHAGVDPNTLPGVVSVENAILAAKYAAGYVAWAVSALVSSTLQRV
jgi:hypothetical protein